MNNQFFNAVLSAFLWKMFLLFLAVLVFALLFGFVLGIFTYGKPIPRRGKNDGALDDCADIGIALSHMLIGMIIRKMKGKATTANQWLSDRGLLGILRSLHPSEFEEIVAKLFNSLGYRTHLVGGSHDGGVDIEIEKDGRHSIVQCKKYITSKVNVHEVRDFLGAMVNHHVDDRGFFVTTNIFTLEAEQLVETNPIELIDGFKLVELIRKNDSLLQELSQKRVANIPVHIDQKCPSCGSELVKRRNAQNGSAFLGCSKFPSCRFTKSL